MYIPSLTINLLKLDLEVQQVQFFQFGVHKITLAGRPLL